MTLRIAHGTWFISREYSETFGTFFIQSNPQIQTWCALVLSFMIQLLSYTVLFNGFLPIFVKVLFHAVVGILRSGEFYIECVPF